MLRAAATELSETGWRASEEAGCFGVMAGGVGAQPAAEVQRRALARRTAL